MSRAGNGWIGVDLDGTLARYDGWRGIEHIGEPIAPMVERVREWLAEGLDVRIFTARVHSFAQDAGKPRDIPQARAVIEAWCLNHLGRVLPITNVKDYGMIELWDDRAVQVIPNVGHSLAEHVQQLEDALELALPILHYFGAGPGEQHVNSSPSPRRIQEALKAVRDRLALCGEAG